MMDRFNDRVPIRTDGRVWYEPLKCIRSINGEPASDVEKSMLKRGDRVTLEYKAKIYHGVVDPDVFQQPGSKQTLEDMPPCQQPPAVEDESLDAALPTTAGVNPRKPPELAVEQGRSREVLRTSPRRPRKRKFQDDSASSPPRGSTTRSLPPKKRLVPKKAGKLYLHCIHTRTLWVKFGCCVGVWCVGHDHVCVAFADSAVAFAYFLPLRTRWCGTCAIPIYQVLP